MVEFQLRTLFSLEASRNNASKLHQPHTVFKTLLILYVICHSYHNSLVETLMPRECSPEHHVSLLYACMCRQGKSDNSIDHSLTEHRVPSDTYKECVSLRLMRVSLRGS